MGFEIKGYVLEPPRVGSANSPFTPTPNVVISDGSAFSTAYPASETNPRTDYLVLVTSDGKLPDATFGWTKNEGLTTTGPAVQRFDYDGRKQSFTPLRGAAPTAVGTVVPTANTTRFKVPVPIGVTAAAPFRLSVGSTGSGTTLATTLVTTFGAPTAGTVEIASSGPNAGELNWNPADLTTYDGQVVRFQRQSFFTTKETNGKLGLIEDNALLLTPIPGTGQFPLIRIGYGLWLITDEVADESGFSVDPPSGHVEWAATTGLLKFNSGDLSVNAGRSIYYDGCLFARALTLPIQSLGTVNAAGNSSPQGTTLSPVPAFGGDIIFRVPGVVQFDQAIPVTSFDAVGKQGQVQYDLGGQVVLSLSDRGAYGGQPLEVVSGDLPIERGISMRFFRTPVDPSGTSSTKDISSIYQVTGATWSDPIIAVPQVFLPSVPVDDSSYPITVSITQGTGSFTGVLPRHDVVGPPAGLGYVIDYDQNILQYTERHNDLLVPIPQATAIGILPDPLLIDSQASFALETGVGTGLYTTLVRDVDYLLDVTAGQVYFTTTFGVRRAEGSGASFSGTTFTDTGADFVTAGVAIGDLLVVASGPAKGVYDIAGVSSTTLTTNLAGATDSNIAYEVRFGKEVLTDRFFQEVLVVDPNTKVERMRTLAALTNSPRLMIETSRVAATRFLFVDGTETTTALVANDGAFTDPSSLAGGTIEVSQETGNLNFSADDLTAVRVAQWVFRLTQGKDYRISPILGFIEFTERMFAGEQALITYAASSDPTVVIQEPATFLVRKEQVQDHPLPVTTLTFNPDGHMVAPNPSPRVFRGGRPQVPDVQVTIDAAASKLTFLPDGQLTDALPHGAIVDPVERVLVDYYIFDAIGGEKTTTVLQVPMSLARVSIVQGSTSFAITGDWTASFPASYLLRVNNDQVYLLASSTFDAPSGLTTITLDGEQTFRNDDQDPKLFVSSGPTRTVSATFFPAYFVPEMSAYDAVARGMNIVKVAGDRTASYKSGSVIMFVVGSALDTYAVSGAKFNPATNRTEVSLNANVWRQYTTNTLKYSARPIVEATTLTAPTNLNPVLTFPGDPKTQQYGLFRRVEGAIGNVLASPADYTIDSSGVVTLTSALLPNEELSIFYTGLKTVAAGLRLKSSFTHITSPNTINGLQGQVLHADYFTFSPDNAYYRVETITIFRGETAEDFESQAKAATPGGGPMTSNMSSPQLNEQGRESVFFQEGHLGNQDIIARSVLKFYNDAVNDLEDSLHAIDGRVVGDQHGRFKFDGLNTNPVRTDASQVTNQIDDLLVVSPFPQPNGTSQPIYLSGPFSRFFCTRRNLFAGPTLDGSNDGDPIAKFAFANLSSLPGNARRRSPRAQILKSYPAGTTTFEVDNSMGTNDALLKPAFQNNTRVVIQDALGTFYINDAAHVTVTGTTLGPPQTITLSGGSGSAIPQGATIYLSPSDASDLLSDSAQDGYAMVYRFGKDIDANLDTGELLFIERAFPFDGTLPTLFIPKILLINEVPPGDILQVNGAGLFVTYTAPYRFPALDGLALDDDGDQAVPLLNPTFDGEMTITGGGPLFDELSAITTGTGTFYTEATQPYTGTGSLNPGKTIITDSAAYSGTLPQIYDLVRILDGANGATAFKRITAVGSNTITVDSPFAVVDAGFSYTIAVSSLAITGTATLSGTTVTDGTATFLSNGTRVGHTVVVTSGPDIGLRRQVVAVVSNTVLTINSSFPTTGAAQYRVDNPLQTFGGPGSPAATVSSALSTEIATISSNPNSQQAALNAFFTTVFTTVLPSPNGTVLIADLTQLIDTSVDFVSSSVTSSLFVFVQAGANMGIYPIATVDSPTQLTLGAPFPAPITGMTYSVVSSFGAGLKTLQDIFGILSANDIFLSSTQAFQALVDTAIPVTRVGVSDPTAFARGYLTSDVSSRATSVEARTTYLTDPAVGPIAKVQNALSGTERLYDKRYTWIDARINMEKGLLVKQKRAIENRIKAQIDILNQLTKLLAVKQ